MKRCYENMQQIYRCTAMPKCDINKVAKNFIKITLPHGFSPVNLLHICRIPFLQNTSEGLLSKIGTFTKSRVNTYTILGDGTINVIILHNKRYHKIDFLVCHALFKQAQLLKQTTKFTRNDLYYLCLFGKHFCHVLLLIRFRVWEVLRKLAHEFMEHLGILISKRGHNTITEFHEATRSLD